MIVNAVIPAKGTSSRVEGKNLRRNSEGKSLTYLACEKCLEVSNIDNVYLDTDSQEIIDDVKRLLARGLKILWRPPELQREVPGNNRINELLVHAAENSEPCDVILHVHVTAPLLTANTLQRVIEEYIENIDTHDSFFTATHFRDYLWTPDHQAVNFDPEGELVNCADLPKFWLESHGAYGVKTATLASLKKRVGRRPLPIEIPDIEAFDVNSEQDLKLLRIIEEE
tara:strand:+ start:5598 stop:6275 length:678 start_codon:yes stop_codon:yes gene_type:complete